MRLRGSVVLLTGATGGMGQCILGSLISAGAEVVVVGLDEAVLARVVAHHGSSVVPVRADIRNKIDREHLVQIMKERAGFNLLINAAGINDFDMFEHQSDAQVSDMVDINLTSTLLLTRSMLPLLKRAPEASVVMIGSTFGAIGYPGFATYCATKFALRGFSEALRRELADTQVGVLYLAPRATRTAMNSKAIEQMNQALKVKTDAPEEVARRLMLALEQGLSEVHLGFPERLFIRINGLLPNLVGRSIHKQLSVIRRFATQVEES